MNNAKAKILLIDDNEEVLDAVQFALSDLGYDVRIAHDGSEGLALVERDTPDLVVLDVVMPRRSGFAVLNQIRERFRNPPKVIMLTASDEPRHREFAHSHGAADFLSKPFDIDELVARIEELLNETT